MTPSVFLPHWKMPLLIWKDIFIRFATCIHYLPYHCCDWVSHFLELSFPGNNKGSPKPFSADIFSCDQAAIWLVQSVRPSVRLSVRPSVRLSVTPFSPCSHHRIIMKFSGVITMVKSDVHAKGQGQRSKVKVTEVNTQLSRFRTLTPVWIHIWQWNHAHSWKQHRRGALLFFKVIHQISRSHGSKNRRLWPKLGVSGL